MRGRVLFRTWNCCRRCPPPVCSEPWRPPWWFRCEWTPPPDVTIPLEVGDDDDDGNGESEAAAAAENTAGNTPPPLLCPMLPPPVLLTSSLALESDPEPPEMSLVSSAITSSCY